MITAILILNIIMFLVLIMMMSAVGGIKISIDKSMETIQFMVYAASRQGQAAKGEQSETASGSDAKSIIEKAMAARAEGAEESKQEQPAQPASDAPEAQPNA